MRSDQRRSRGRSVLQHRLLPGYVFWVTDSNRDGYCDCVCVGNSNSIFNLHGDCDRDRHQHRHADSYVNRDLHGEPYSYGYRHYHRHADLDCGVKRNTYDDA